MQSVVVPAEAKQPQDHRTAKAEATGDTPPPMTVQWRGEIYSIRGDAFSDIDIVERIGDMLAAPAGEQGFHVTTLLRTLLGTQQWRAFKVANPKVEAVFGLWNAVDDAAGKYRPSAPAS